MSLHLSFTLYFPATVNSVSVNDILLYGVKKETDDTTTVNEVHASYRHHTGIIQASYRHHTGIIQASYRHHTGNIDMRLVSKSDD